LRFSNLLAGVELKTVPESIKHDLCLRFGGTPESLRFLGGGRDWSDGVVFTFTPAAPVAPRSKVLKIIEFEPDDAEGLARAGDKVRLVRTFGEQGARIAFPEPSPGGSLFETLEEGGRVFMAYVCALVRGRPLEKKDRLAHSSAYYRALGSLLGRLHTVSEARPEMLANDGTSSVGGAIKGWRDEWEFFRTWCKDDEVGQAWERLRDELLRLPVDKAGYGFVHNDAHVWNILCDPEWRHAASGDEPELTLIDFDCANYHWYMSDAAITLYSTLGLAAGGLETESGPPEGFREKAFAAFWEGYGRHRQPGQVWLDRLELFLHFRRCILFMPFQEETAKHPAWRERWKQRILEGNRRLFGGA
jgi:Ser/Thr protein kinase RdoA (MazF antagonist)